MYYRPYLRPCIDYSSLMKVFRYRTLLLLPILAISALIILAGSTFYQISTVDRNSLKKLGNSFELAQRNFSILADLIYKNYFHDRPDILALIYKANKAPSEEKALIRQTIIDRLDDHYRLIRHLGVKQFHIHLADGSSFIRFHRLEKWGDSLIGIRKTIEMVMHTHRTVRGFEEGRIFSGFRNVYPLGFKGQYIGSVEISAGLQAIAAMMHNNTEHIKTEFILSKNLPKRKVFKDELKQHYSPVPYAKGFVVDESPYESGIFIGKRESLEDDVDLVKALSKHDLTKTLLKFKPFYKYLWINGQLVHFFFFPFREFEGSWAGYLVVAKRANLAERMLKLFFYQAMVTLFIFFLLGAWLFNQEKRLLFHSSRDALTGAFNRRNGIKELERTIALANRTGARNTIIFFDIDDFKVINDTFGHKMGDRVLQALVKFLRSALRRTDVIVRYGGEEFIVLLPNTKREDAIKVAEKVRKGIEKLEIDGVLRLTVSIGVAEYRSGEQITEWIGRADKAMYESKHSGKNRVTVAS